MRRSSNLASPGTSASSSRSVLLVLILSNATALALVAALSLAACAIPDSQFEAVDGGGELPGGPVLTIVPSSTALEVAEAGEVSLMVKLSQAPAAPLKVSVATPSTKIALGQPELFFTAETFDQPQRLTVTALADADTVTEHAEITLSAPAVTSVVIGASVNDDDTVQIATNIGTGAVVSINETGTATVRVHLTAQPGSDVRVDALVAAGPVSVTGPSSRTFSAENYDVDQTFTFTAANDANVTSEDIALTLRATGVPAGVPDKLATLRTVDDDTLNILITPSTLEVVEDGAAGIIDVSLTQQPAVGADVTVMITTTTGQTSVNLTQVTFNSTNYSTPKQIAVTGRDDNDTANGSDTIRFAATGLTERTTAVTVRDPDIQKVLVDAANPLVVAENGDTTFNATLKFRPTTDVVVAVSSLNSAVATATTGVLRFTSSDYMMAHPVTVHGTDDNNLAVNTTSIRISEATLGNLDVPVSVTDTDTQRFIVSETALSIAEGTTKTFDVSLAYDPGTTVTGTVVSSNPTSLPVSAANLSFNSTTYGTPVRITVAPPVDTNNVAETATITVSGCGAATPATVAATAMELTQLVQYGWPTPFQATTAIAAGTVIAYRVSVATTSRLDSFGIFVPAAAGDFRMALYANVGTLPTNLVAEIPVRRALVNGVNTVDITPDPLINAGDYWLVLRVGQQTAVGYSPADVTGPRCIRQVDIPNLDDAWPSSFGTANCGTGRLLNLWINNYFQQ